MDTKKRARSMLVHLDLTKLGQDTAPFDSDIAALAAGFDAVIREARLDEAKWWARNIAG